MIDKPQIELEEVTFGHSKSLWVTSYHFESLCVDSSYFEVL